MRDYNLVWQTIHNRILKIKPMLKTIQKELEKNDNQ